MTTLPCPAPAERRPSSRTAALIGASALAGLFLAACGDGGSGLEPPAPPPPPAPVTQVPASAADSSASLEAFAISQPLSETAEPLTLELVPTFPTSETDPPIEIS